jgi:O-glycosyl hydrolase
MRRSSLLAGISILLLPILSLPDSPAAEAAVTTSVVDPNTVYVSDFEGWGTALAWGANVVGGWSDAKRNEIADLLFSRSGLGLNVVRYHIGAGQDPSYQALGCATQRPGSPLPTYAHQQGVYDWSADANQRWFAQAAKARGANKWLAYASAPPYWMTINGCTNGGDGGGQNLKGYWGYDGDGTGAYNGTTSYSNHTNDSVTVAFTGTQISFYASKSADSGKAAISVDGGAETVVDLYSATRQGNQLVYTSPALPSGNHTLQVRVTGTKSASSSGYFVSPDRVLVNGSTSVDDHVRGTGQNQFNYHWHMYEPFADYLTEVTKHFRDSWGITFDLLDPLNEPDATWWTKTTRQEGAHFDPPSQDELITRVGQSLTAKGLTGTTIAAPDADTVANGTSSFNSYSAAARNYISTIATHTYITTPSDQVTLRNTAASAGKKLWMSEYGSGESAFGVSPGAYSDPTKAQPAINLASQITTDLTNLRPSAWIQWDGIESWEENDSANMSWGLIWGRYLDPAQTWMIAKQYYGYGNFTKFIRPGDRIVASGDANTVAAYDPVSKKVVLVVYNDSTSSRSVTYDLSRFSDNIPGATPYRTSDTESLAQLADVPMTGNQLTTTLAPKSVTTFVMPGISNGGQPQQLVSELSDKCASVADWSTADGAAIVQWGCGSGSANQSWTLAPAGQGRYQLRSALSDKCASVADWSTADGAAIVQWGCGAGSANQLWKVEPVDEGYHLRSVHSDRCASVADWSTDDGAAIIQWECGTGSANQIWLLD